MIQLKYIYAKIDTPKSGKGFICINVRIIKNLNIIQQLFNVRISIFEFGR